jgi:hypothetical protein
MIATPISQQKLTRKPSKPRAERIMKKDNPNRLATVSPSHETQPHIPGRQTAEPTTIIPIEMASIIAGLFICLLL